MSLAADDAEIEQNEMRAMQTQLDHTQKLLVQVAQQLNDVKEQVRLCTVSAPPHRTSFCFVLLAQVW